LLKTFWTAWLDEQLPDGTVTRLGYVLETGSDLVSRFPFLALCLPTGEIPTVPKTYRPSGDRGVMMPTRRRTREQDHAHRIDAERALNAAHVAERAKPPPF
jgi:hypothetical protein